MVEVFAVGVEEVALDKAAECKNVFGPRTQPTHAGEFGALSNDVSASTFDSP